MTPRRFALRASFIVSATLLAACGSNEKLDRVDIPDGFPKAECDALDTAHCALPWPSSLYLDHDDTAPSGHALRFGATSLPTSSSNVPLDPNLFVGLDGYGLGTPIIAGFGDLDLSNLPSEWDGLESSIGSESRSILLEVGEAGLRPVPHFVERDGRGEPETGVTFLRPAEILKPATRYIVAFRGLVDTSGVAIAPSEGFLALRDRISSRDAGIAWRRDRFEEIFSQLASYGVAREELVLAWDFVTGSEARLHGRLDEAVAAALEDAPDGGALEIVTVYPKVPADDGMGTLVNPDIQYAIDATMTVPAVVTPAEPGGAFRIELDASGHVITNGTFTTKVLIQVPHAATAENPMGVIVYGHGMFGSEAEIYADHLELIANQFGYVVVAVPMVGMSHEDLAGVMSAIPNMNEFPVLTDGLIQGMVNHHMLARAVKSGALATLLTTAVDPDIVIDTDDLRYFGGSQGGIYGATFLATSPDVHRGVLAVPGNNYATLLSRSVNFEPFYDILKFTYPGDANVAALVGAVQLLWDRTDPVSFLGRLLEGGGDASKQALFLVSKGDYQVAVLTNEIAARTYPGLAVMEHYDAERAPFGLVETSYPHTGSGMILFDFGNPWPTDRGNLPPDDGLTDPHSRIAEVEAAGDLIDNFLRTGEIIDVCGGDGCTPD
jgi:hypothetical protein